MFFVSDACAPARRPSKQPIDGTVSRSITGYTRGLNVSPHTERTTKNFDRSTLTNFVEPVCSVINGPSFSGRWSVLPHPSTPVSGQHRNRLHEAREYPDAFHWSGRSSLSRWPGAACLMRARIRNTHYNIIIIIFKQPPGLLILLKKIWKFHIPDRKFLCRKWYLELYMYNCKKKLMVS